MSNEETSQQMKDDLVHISQMTERSKELLQKAEQAYREKEAAERQLKVATHILGSILRYPDLPESSRESWCDAALNWADTLIQRWQARRTP